MLTEIKEAPAAELHQRLHRFRTYLMIGVIITAAPLGNVFLGKGMKESGALRIWPLPALLATGLQVFSSPFIWLGIGLLGTFFIAYMLLLSWADYSFVQPATSLSYAVIALLSYLILGEKLSLLHCLGIGVICLGVFVVSRTGVRSVRPETVER